MHGDGAALMRHFEPRKTPAASSASRTRSRYRLLLALVCVAQGLVTIDITIVNVALPSISRDLAISGAGLQWVVTAYTLVLAGFLLLGGRAADVFGLRRMFLLGVFTFTAASVVGGLAQDSATLIAARGLQGFGGAILAPATIMIITTNIREPIARARAFGVFGGMASTAAAAGAIAGGLLTDATSWRWIFFINAPLGGFAMIISWRLLRDGHRDRGSGRFDPLGAALATIGLTAIVYGLVGTEHRGWIAPETGGALLTGVLIVGIFVLDQRFRHSAALLPLRVFRIRAVSAANLVMVFFSAVAFSSYYFFALFMQNVLQFSPTQAGLSLLPYLAMNITGAFLSSRLLIRIGLHRLLAVGGTIALVGLALMAGADRHAGFFPQVAVAESMVALGMSMSMLPTINIGTSIGRGEAGLASGLINVSRRVGDSLGLAILATVAAAHTRSVLTAATDSAGGPQPDPRSPLAIEALATGYGRAFLVAAVLLVVGFTIALTLLPAYRSPAPTPGAGTEQ